MALKCSQDSLKASFSDNKSATPVCSCRRSSMRSMGSGSWAPQSPRRCFPAKAGLLSFGRTFATWPTTASCWPAVSQSAQAITQSQSIRQSAHHHHQHHVIIIITTATTIIIRPAAVIIIPTAIGILPIHLCPCFHHTRCTHTARSMTLGPLPTALSSSSSIIRDCLPVRV